MISSHVDESNILGREKELEGSRKIFDALGEIGASFSSPARLKIIQLLSQAPRSVDEIATLTDEGIKNTSQHLQRLLKSGAVKVTRKGLHRIYELRTEQVTKVWEDIQELAGEILGTLEGQITESPVGIREVIKEMEQGTAQLIDVRDAYEAEKLSIQQAIRIPLSEIESRLDELDPAKTCYVFCRGRFCPIAESAVRILKSAGMKAYRLSESPQRIAKIIQT